MIRNWNIKTKSALILTGVFFLLIVISSAIIFYGYKNEQKKTLEDYQFTMVSILAMEISEKLNISHEALFKVAENLPASYFEDTLKLQHYIESNSSLYALFHNILIYSNKGVVLAAYPSASKYRGEDLSRLEYVKKTLKDGKAVVSAPFISPVSKEPLIVMTSPIFNMDGKILGFIGGSQYFLKKNLLGNVMSAKIGNTGYFYITTMNRTVLVHPNKEFILKTIDPEGTNPSYDAALEGYEGTREDKSEISGHALFSMKALGFSDWLLVGVYPTKEAFSPIQKSKKNMILIALGTAVLTSLIVWFTIHYLLLPLTVLHHHIKEFADKRDENSEINIRWNDEIGKLSNSFNEMMRKLKQSDIQHLKMETLLRHQQKMESIGQLAGGIAHDFNNVLYPIIGFTEISMEDLPKTHPVQENLKDILDGAKRARDLVKQILLFSRQEKPDLQSTILRPVIEETVKLMRSTIPANINIQTQFYDGEDHVLCDETAIHEIVMNLCTNAYHSIEKSGGNIKVSLNKTQPGPDSHLPSGEYIRLSVSDNGTGIPEKIKDKIFEPYFTTKEVGKGSGIGLSVVYGIVKNYRGDIQVKSSPEKGTTFNIFLPVITKTIDLEQEQEQKIPLSGTENILFVDDESAIVKLGVRILERLGYKVTGVQDSSEALTLFKSKPENFDIVITDMAMPVMEGTELAQKIFEIRPEIPIILCSGFSEKIDLDKANRFNIKAFIDKPILGNDLTTKVRELLDQSKKG